jgi:hypothetical protein
VRELPRAGGVLGGGVAAGVLFEAAGALVGVLLGEVRLQGSGVRLRADAGRFVGGDLLGRALGRGRSGLGRREGRDLADGAGPPWSACGTRSGRRRAARIGGCWTVGGGRGATGAPCGRFGS